VLELSPDAQITFHYKTSSLSWKKTRIDTRRVFASFSEGQTPDLSVAQDGIRVVFSCQATDTVLSTPQPTAQTIQIDAALSPTTQAILQDCPR
jgi:hypothetical protein